jgi:hypothetical protein
MQETHKFEKIFFGIEYEVFLKNTSKMRRRVIGGSSL